ncbi:MAG: hypothetical protein NDJ90_12365, partial [Oligoflexia bacterium]|nr:hypothetical protein [Oligoflexia bacterium]
MKKTRIAAVTLVSLSLAALVACSRAPNHPYRKGIDSAPEVRAPDRIQESFTAIQGSPLPLSVQDERFVAIRKDALDKEFLLHGSMIPQTEMPTSRGLQARVVAFHRVGDQLFLLEATRGHVVTRDVSASLILAEIPILRETRELIVMDFNAGMRQAFIASNWKGSESETNGKPQYEDDRKVLKVRHSFLEKVRTVDVAAGNYLEIHQLAQMEGSRFDIEERGEVSTAQTVGIRYYLTPYRPNPDFQPRE